MAEEESKGDAPAEDPKAAKVEDGESKGTRGRLPISFPIDYEDLPTSRLWPVLLRRLGRW